MLGGSMGWASLLVLWVSFLVYPCSSLSQTSSTENVTKEITIPSISEFTTSGKTFSNSKTTTNKGCDPGAFCTGGATQGGTYTTNFNLQDHLSIDEIQGGFSLDSSVDVDSHPSNLTVPVCNSTTQASPDCKDVFSLTIRLFDSTSVGQNLVHTFEHEVQLDFRDTRTFNFTDIVPENEFSAMTGQMLLFGIDAGFGSKFFGPSFSNPSLSANFDVITILENQIIDVINNSDVLDVNIPTNTNVTDMVVEVNTPGGEQIASLEMEVQLEMPVDLAPPSVDTNIQVASIDVSSSSQMEGPSVETQIETEMQNDLSNDLPDPSSGPGPSSSTEGGTEPATESGQEAGAEGPTTEAEDTAQEPEESSSGSDSVDESNDEPETASNDPEPEAAEEPEAEPETQTAEVKKPEPKPQAKAKAKAKVTAKKKAAAKQKAAKKILKKMGDKGKYQSTNQLKTLIVMNVLGNSRKLFTPTTLVDTPGFFSTDRLPDTQISDNNVAAYFLMGGSDKAHSELTDSQYK